MREILQDIGQVLGAAGAIAGFTVGLLSGNSNIVLKLIFSLLIATAAGIIVSTIVKRGIIRR